MTILTRCPECGHKYRFDDKHVGRQAKCKNGHVFTVRSADHAVPGDEPAILDLSSPQVATELDETENPAQSLEESEMLDAKDSIDLPEDGRKKPLMRLLAIAFLTVPVLVLLVAVFSVWFSDWYPKHWATYSDPYEAAKAGSVRELKRMHQDKKLLDNPRVIFVTPVDYGVDENGMRVQGSIRIAVTPLQAAVARGQLDAVVYLLQAGCNPWKRDADTTYSAVEEAYWPGRTEILNAILDPANYKPAEDGSSLLHGAARANCSPGIRLLLQHGASVNAKNKKGHTPVYEAAYRGYDECVKLLLSSGANPKDVEKADRDRLVEQAKGTADSKVK